MVSLENLDGWGELTEFTEFFSPEFCKVSMLKCPFCGKEVSESAKKCPHCRKRLQWSLFQQPAVLVAAAVCSVICFAYLHTFTNLPDWVSALLSIPIATGLIALLWRIGD
jgi:uncharacterized OB-fold protein